MTLTPQVRRCAFTLLSIALVPHPALAQATVSRVEVGGDVSVADVDYSPRVLGISARFDVNVTPTLAMESRVTRFAVPFGIGAGFHVTGGVRARLVHGRRVSLYGLALPGVYRAHTLSFDSPIFLPDDTPIAILIAQGHLSSSPSTHFVLDMGLGLVVAPTSRLLARIEVNRDLHAPQGTVETFVSGGTTYRLPEPSPITGSWNLHVGGSYRLGGVLPAPRAPAVAGRWTIGPQIGYTISTSAAVNSAAGVFAAYRLSKWCDIEASTSAFLRSTLPSSIYEGGRVFQAVGGVKLGVRDGRFGVFFKVRSGVNRESKVFSIDTATEFRALTLPVLDLGGVIETYLSRRSTLRVDLGETLNFVPNFGVLFGGSDNGGGRERFYGLPVRVGVGWRF